MPHASIESLAAAQIAIANRIIRRSAAGDESVDHDALRLAELVLDANRAKAQPREGEATFSPVAESRT